VKRLTTLKNLLKDKSLDYENVIEEIENSSYSVSTKSNFFYALIKNNELNLYPDIKFSNEELQLLQAKLEHYKNLTIANHQLLKQERSIIHLEEFETLVRDAFPCHDMRLLIALLYIWWPLRDDLQICYLQNKDNHIYKENGKLYLCIQRSKRIWAPITREIPDELTSLIKQYVDRNGIKEGEYLFGKGKKTWLVQRMFKRLGLKGGINTIRQMHRKKALRSKDRNQILNTAKLSFHSIKTAEHYDEYTN